MRDHWFDQWPICASLASPPVLRYACQSYVLLLSSVASWPNSLPPPTLALRAAAGFIHPSVSPALSLNPPSSEYVTRPALFLYQITTMTVAATTPSTTNTMPTMAPPLSAGLDGGPAGSSPGQGRQLG